MKEHNHEQPRITMPMRIAEYIRRLKLVCLVRGLDSHKLTPYMNALQKCKVDNMKCFFTNKEIDFIMFPLFVYR